MKKHPRKLTLQAYWENELTETQSAIIKEHLLDCSECSQIVEGMMNADKTLKKMETPKLSLAKENDLFKNAFAILDERRGAEQSKVIKIEERKEKIKSLTTVSFTSLKYVAPVAACLAIYLQFNDMEISDGRVDPMISIYQNLDSEDLIIKNEQALIIENSENNLIAEYTAEANDEDTTIY